MPNCTFYVARNSQISTLIFWYHTTSDLTSVRRTCFVTNTFDTITTCARFRLYLAKYK